MEQIQKPIGKITAPFTEEQIKALNEHQKNDDFHPYTCCGQDYPECERTAKTGEGVLIATTEGWICPCGKYKQGWAHSAAPVSRGLFYQTSSLSALHETAIDLMQWTQQTPNEEVKNKLRQAAAIIENMLADYYIERDDLEPTRSILCRSAAWINDKAGNTQDAIRYFELPFMKLNEMETQALAKLKSEVETKNHAQ